MLRDQVSDDQRQRRGRKDPPGAADVELSERQPPTQQQPGDQIAREDEEDVDADVAAQQVGDTGVGEDDQEHGNSPQSLNVLSVRHALVPFATTLPRTC